MRPPPCLTSRTRLGSSYGLGATGTARWNVCTGEVVDLLLALGGALREAKLHGPLRQARMLGLQGADGLHARLGVLVWHRVGGDQPAEQLDEPGDLAEELGCICMQLACVLGLVGLLADDLGVELVVLDEAKRWTNILHQVPRFSPEELCSIGRWLRFGDRVARTRVDDSLEQLVVLKL